MDSMAATTQVGGVLGIVITIVGIVYGAINHKRLRSNCCGRKIEVSVDVDTTTVMMAKPPSGTSLDKQTDSAKNPIAV